MLVNLSLTPTLRQNDGAPGIFGCECSRVTPFPLKRNITPQR